MLKSLFEASIDRLNIPVDMKTAIKEINNICLEAEGDNKGNAAEGDDKGYTPMSKEDIEKGKKLTEEANKKKVNEEYKYEAFPQEQKGAPAKEAPKFETNVENAKSQEDAFSILKNLQQKAVQNRGTPEGEKWRQMLETEYDKALNKKLVNRTKGFEMTIYNKGNQPAQNTAEKPAETKPAQATEQAATNAEQQQAPAENKGEQQAQENAKPAAPKYRKGADVATVQFFIRSKHPETELVGDGVLGPKTIQAIQKVEDLNQTGKMDQATQQAFDKMLKEAKVKVKELQEKLGVTADGLIGKQTLAAMNKANMNVANLFSTQPSNEAYAAKQSAPAATQAKAAENPVDKELTSRPFDEKKANFMLEQKSITQQAYNIWKNFGIAPYFQKKKPNETKAFIAKANQAKKNERTVAANTSGAPEQATPQNEEEKKFYDSMKKNYLKVYQVSAKQKGKSELWASNMAENAAQEALAKKRNGTWGKTQEPNTQQAVAQNNGQQAKPAQQPQQASAQKPQQAAAPQNPNAKAKGNGEVYQRTQDGNKTTEYYAGNYSLYNLSDDEKKLKKQAEEQMKAKYFDKDGRVKINPKTKQPYNEDIALQKIDNAGVEAVINRRMEIARAKQG